MCSSNCWLMTGAVVAGLAVAAGAFGAHGLDRQFYAKYAGQTYEKNYTVGGYEQVVSQPLAQK